jgi:hypothetical protein
MAIWPALVVEHEWYIDVANDEVPAKRRAGVSQAMKVVARDLGLERPCRVKWFRPASKQEVASQRTTSRAVTGAWDSQNGHISGIVLPREPDVVRLSITLRSPSQVHAIAGHEAYHVRFTTWKAPSPAALLAHELEALDYELRTLELLGYPVDEIAWYARRLDRVRAYRTSLASLAGT